MAKKTTTPKPRPIRKWSDLSFTKRAEDGRLLSWFMPSRTNDWHEHYGIGEAWFDEIVQFAHTKPEEAYRAMMYAAREACTKYGDFGHTDGFFDMMARWAMAGILANQNLPELPFKTTRCSIPVREGMDFLLAREGKKDPLADGPYVERGTRFKDTSIRPAVQLVAIDGDLVPRKS